jgi:hypothetical protein
MRSLRLDEIHARIPSIDCQRRCHTTCGLIPLSPPEARRVKRHQLRVVPYGNSELMFDAPLGVCPAATGLHDLRRRTAHLRVLRRGPGHGVPLGMQARAAAHHAGGCRATSSQPRSSVTP